MAVSMADLGLDRLSADDRLSLVEQIWDSLATEAEATPLTAAQRDELDRRLALHEANPDQAVPWEQVRDRALKRARG